ncbi:hypothetical protein AKJ48_04190 [candidate division MSBL1 archaeon SCGC-AAA261O19]|uniref:Uncharacterized protein n=1 Tax=candidate division MSBL1 archaeon SCGC-AAA261O19 TaxID=1698277 RepID=A0A133V9P5_9EURY|nr:hypothetical protein AKJ48_04190 [candidate division MSBL1 archaeon SCGC-AAA261O19]
MREKTTLQGNKLKERLKIINWFGIGAGILMLALPFLGAWWQAEVGTGAMELAFSPFYYHVSFLEQTLTSPLVGYFILAAKLMIIIGGALMITGSMATDRWWGKKLMRFGAMKVFWFLIILIALLLLGAFFVNNFLPGILSGMVEGGGGVTTQFQVPYIAGSTTSTIQASGATISAPISTSLTSAFWIAVITAGLGIAARIYHGRLVKKLGVEVD